MIVQQEKFASEGGTHWYRKDGSPCYEVPNASKPGELRPTTIRDAKKMGLYPSVTGIIKIMGKGDGLTHWVKRQVAEAAWDNIEQIGNLYTDQRDDGIKLILDRAEERMTSQRDKGTRDHGAVEGYFRLLSETDGKVGDQFSSIYDDSRAVEAVLTAFGKLGISGQRVASEKSFSHPMGFGGKIDVSGSEEMWITDFKFVDRLEKKLDYLEKCIQGAAYLVGRYGEDGLRKGRFANIFVETEQYCFVIREWSREELQKGWRVFSLLHSLWCEINDYRP